MVRICAIAALILSIVVFGGQIFLFTKTEEQIVWGGLGVLVYALAIAKVMAPLGSSSTRVAVSWGAISGIILGFLPPRLRLGGSIDSFVFLFPLIHVVALVLFFWLARKGHMPATPSGG